MLDELTINEQEIGYCIVPAKCINTTKIKNNSEYEIGAYIPKLMSEIEMRDEPYVDTISGLRTDMIINKKYPIRFPNKIKLCNFVRINPYSISNTSPPIISNGEKFYIKFINQDIKKPTYTSEFTEEEKRLNDLYEIKVRSTDEVDESTNIYSLYLNGIEQKSGIKLNDDIFIELSEEHKKITIQYGNTNFTLNDNKFEINSKDVILNGDLNINGNLLINNRTLEDIIDARCAANH